MVGNTTYGRFRSRWTGHRSARPSPIRKFAYNMTGGPLLTVFPAALCPLISGMSMVCRKLGFPRRHPEKPDPGPRFGKALYPVLLSVDGSAPDALGVRAPSRVSLTAASPGCRFHVPAQGSWRWTPGRTIPASFSTLAPAAALRREQPACTACNPVLEDRGALAGLPARDFRGTQCVLPFQYQWGAGRLHPYAWWSGRLPLQPPW